MTLYTLHTLNSFTFRGNGSFQSTETTAGHGVFPPYPQTIYGALRNNWIEHHGNTQAFLDGQYDDRIGTTTSHGSMRLEGVYLVKNHELFLPLPLDCQVMEEDNQFKAEFLMLQVGQTYESDGQVYRLRARHNVKSVSADNMWLSVSSWSDLIDGKAVQAFPISHFVHRQPKIGIARDYATGTVMESMLYQLDQYQFKPGASLAIQAHDVNDISALTMGRQGTLWSIQASAKLSQQWDEFKNMLLNKLNQAHSEFIRVTFMSPFIASKDLKTSQGKHRFFDAEWVAAATGRVEMVGGWDMAAHQPKPRYPVLPAGSSYILKAPKQESLREFSEKIYGNEAYSDFNIEAGFGRFIVTATDIQNKGE